MQKTILLTGATDGIGLETAKRLAADGHTLLIHGRNPDKLARVKADLVALPGAGEVEAYVADFSDLADVNSLADTIRSHHDHLDVLINNAGILRTQDPLTKDGMDVRFVVNTIAPYLLTRKLLALMGNAGRVVNLSSAAQAPVNLKALAGQQRASDMEAYAQSKLAITMWTRDLARELGSDGPVIVAVNPASLLGTKMVKEGFGVSGSDISVGVDILIRASLSKEFEGRSGAYFDNDSGRFADPHPSGMDPQACAEVVATIRDVLAHAGLPAS
ncbi:SDR family NAD(P)-dependent oxidoreductase [Roseibium sp.]|uniref:SDR family NAD(P)-dependent oxidoreductase n=1 Tax=Roseibium sp. TaxID=1936156 RepID=UPI003B5105B7